MPFLILIVVIAALMVFTAVDIGLTYAVFLDGEFWAGWHAAWDRPVWLFIFAVIPVIIKVVFRK